MMPDGGNRAGGRFVETGMPASPAVLRSSFARGFTGRTIAVVIALGMVVASCSSDADSTAPSTTETTTTTSAPSSSLPQDTATTAGAPTEIPAISGLDGSIGEASDLVLSWFNGAALEESGYEIAFDPAFREAVTFEQLLGPLDEITSDGPYVVESIRSSTPTTAVLLIVGDSGATSELSVSVLSTDDPTMNALFIGPPQPPFEPPATTDEAITRLEEMGTLRVGSFTDDCRPGGVAVNVDAQAPIGSGFKLWVLAAVVNAEAAGALSWEDEVEIRDELDAYPSGVTQEDPPGSFVTVRELADRMIAISDNTATNHLMDLVGRAAVEQAMIDSGHSAPERNRPLMDAREFTIVKFGDDDLRNRYQAAGEAERRRILDEEVASMPLPPLAAIVSITDPVDVETVEWFASPSDLCRTLTQLADNAVAVAVLSQSAGIPDEAGRWETLLFKGGSEPGVIAMAWLTIDSDGNRYVTAGSVSNETQLIDDAEAANLFAFLRDSAG